MSDWDVIGDEYFKELLDVRDDFNSLRIKFTDELNNGELDSEEYADIANAWSESSIASKEVSLLLKCYIHVTFVFKLVVMMESEKDLFHVQKVVQELKTEMLEDIRDMLPLYKERKVTDRRLERVVDEYIVIMKKGVSFYSMSWDFDDES